MAKGTGFRGKPQDWSPDTTPSCLGVLEPMTELLETPVSSPVKYTWQRQLVPFL